MSRLIAAVIQVVPVDFPSLVQIQYREVIDGMITGTPDNLTKLAPEAWAKARARIRVDETLLSHVQDELKLGRIYGLGNRQLYLDDV